MRCIFLCVDGLDPQIQEFRARYDPLGLLVEPHVTLVFPFEMDSPDEVLIEHVSSKIASTSRFSASIHHQPTMESDYVYLPIDKGSAQVKALHNLLYVGVLEQFRQDRPYVPHITIGRVRNENSRDILEALKSLEIESKIMINRLKIERIGPNGESEIISEHLLGLRT